MDTRTAATHSLIGASKSALDTPALLVDLDIMEAKIARMQIAAGAIGITCAKLGEAEVMAAAGIRDILIANQIVGPIKIDRLVELAGRTDPIVCADSIENLTELDAAFRRAAKPLKV